MTDFVQRGRLAPRVDRRQSAVNEVLVQALLEEDQPESLLLAGGGLDEAAAELRTAGYPLEVWRRRSEGKSVGTSWPEAGEAVDAAVVRMPRSKDELRLSVHAAASRVRDGGRLYVVGANDEGVRSTNKRLKAEFDDLETVLTARHCRVWRGTVRESAPWNTELDAWATPVQPNPIPLEKAADRPWHTYPGVFAGGGLDKGTEALLGVLLQQKRPRSLLDFGCGAGVIAASVGIRYHFRTKLTLLDSDSVSLHTARQNLADEAFGARFVQSDGWAAHGPERYDWIVSNPPIHQGKSESFEVLADLVAGARAHLTQRGQLWIVVQRQVPIQRWLESALDRVKMVAESSRFRVWSAR